MATKILIVDDLATNLLLLEIGLKQDGLEFVRAYDGAQALELSRESEYALILMDIRMPVMSGSEAIEAIRNEPENPNNNTPIIIITADQSTIINSQNYALDVLEFISKPIDIFYLRTKVGNILDAYRRTRSLSGA
ncbi:MAG TPA: response regulator [Gammaproteobacteria bacterium]|nr:response regulator [Gammaproteobacteria bacterium]MDP6094395.1 response regulator [Gammaproteobacteria bacterium]HJP38291.1 response regulator [Gammaproteobacteria bacterium]